MNATLHLDPSLSLYELALNSEPQPPILQISPATFKSVISALVDLLIEQEIGAVIWAKLPRGETWQTELDRYTALPGISKSLYFFKTHREDGIDDATGMPSGLSPDISNHQTLSFLSKDSQSSVSTLELPADTPFRREYFLLVWTAQFQGGILAHRSRSNHSSKSVGNTGFPDLLAGIAEVGHDDGSERKHPLLTLCSFDSKFVEKLLGGVEQTIVQSQTDLLEESQPTSSSSTLIKQWRELIAKTPATAANSQFLELFFTKQLQKQEDVWQRSTSYRKQADMAEALQLQNDELMNAVRLKDDFLNTVGQELRTPLTTIKTALTLLNSQSLKPPQRQRYMDLIEKECDRQSLLITSLLDLVQFDKMAEQTVIEPLRVCDVVPGVVSTYQPLAEEKGVMLAYTVPEDLPPVACANPWLKQIVINLLNNGIRFTPRGGQVWVRARLVGRSIQLEVRDTGVGIAPADIPKIFDRFYRVRQTSTEDASGAGLGLTIVQQLLLHCAGTISVKSKLGEGSIFTVLIPVHPTAKV